MSDTTKPPSLAPSTNQSVSFAGIDHIKLPVHSIARTRQFYTTVFPLVHEPKYNHFTPQHEIFAQMLLHKPTNLILELRYHPAQAAAQKGWDPITWGVSKRQDLEDWAKWLDANGVVRSKVFTAIKGWVLACEDPDGRVVRLYVQDEEHEWTDHPDRDERWLGTPVADPEA